MRIALCVRHRSSIYRLVWVGESKAGIYVGVLGAQEDSHDSYHTDGTRHVRIGDEYHNRFADTPINEFKGFRQLSHFSLSLTKDWFNAKTLYAGDEKTESIVLLDEKLLWDKDTLSLNVWLTDRESEQDLLSVTGTVGWASFICPRPHRSSRGQRMKPRYPPYVCYGPDREEPCGFMRGPRGSAQNVGMSRYRRSRAPGATFFFTVTLVNRKATTLTDHIGELRAAYSTTAKSLPFETLAICVLPDHLHAMWELPPDDAAFSRRWSRIKSAFSRNLPAAEGRSASKLAKREKGIWQRRFWEHQIRDEGDLQRHVDYIHYNPVKHGLVSRVVDWPYSSFHRYVRRGWLAADWGGVAVDADGYGEPD